MPFVNSSDSYIIQELPEFLPTTGIKLSDLRKYWIHKNKKNDRDLVRLLFFITVLLELKSSNIPGSIAELGVYQGNSAKIFRALCPERDLYLFDTFTGFDKRDCEVERASPGGFETSLEEVREFLGAHDKTHYLKGYFPQTTSQLSSNIRFALVHLDADLYHPTKSGLEFFYDKLEPGGFLILHDHNTPHWKGVNQATLGFFADKPETMIHIPDKGGTTLIRKEPIQP